MLTRIFFWILLLCSTAAAAQSAATPSSTVYKCTDRYGKITYANIPCEGQREVMPEWKLQGSTMPALTEAQKSSALAGGSSSASASSSPAGSTTSSITNKLNEVADKLEKSWQGLFSDDPQPSPSKDLPH